MAKQTTKTLVLTTASGVMVWAIQMLSAGHVTRGVLGLLIGGTLYGGYQWAEERDHGGAYQDIVDALGEDTFKSLADAGADVVNDRLSKQPRNADGTFASTDETDSTDDS